MDRRSRGARDAARHVALLLAMLLLAGAPGGAYAAEPEGADAAAAGSLPVPGETRLHALADGVVVDDVVVYDGEIDIVTLQTDALERLASLDAADYDRPSLALALEFELAAAFEFVRDRIGFDPYRGLQRGADGTLAARSGNSLDRAVLLRGILEQMGVPTRFAFAELSEAQADELLGRSFLPPVEPLPAGTPQTRAPLDWASIENRAGRDYARLRAAMGERTATIGTADRGAALADVRSHAWAQAFMGTDWVDLDPTMPDAQPGDRLAEPSLVSDEVPADEVASVSISLTAEIYDGHTYRSSLVLSETLPGWQAADSQIVLSFQPEFAGVGGGIVEALGVARAFVPHLAVAGTDRRGQPFPVTRGTDIFTGETEAGPVTARLRLDIGIGVPGRDDVDPVPHPARSCSSGSRGRA